MKQNNWSSFSWYEVWVNKGWRYEFCLEQQKNNGKTGSIYKKIGRKKDGIFRITTDHMKIRVIETGYKWKGSNRTKYLKDSLKLNKMLKDMIMNLIFENNCN